MDHSELDDESLMLATASGDLAAFEQLVIRHQQKAWRVAFRYAGDQGEAEDLVQEAFLRNLSAAPRYKPTASFRTYFYKILTRLCIDSGRKKRPIPTHPLPQRASGVPAAPERIDRASRDEAIQAALATLPAKYRLVIVLRYFEGLSGIEMAHALDTSPKAVERLLARARKRLESVLRPLLDE